MIVIIVIRPPRHIQTGIRQKKNIVHPQVLFITRPRTIQTDDNRTTETGYGMSFEGTQDVKESLQLFIILFYVAQH